MGEIDRQKPAGEGEYDIDSAQFQREVSHYLLTGRILPPDNEGDDEEWARLSGPDKVSPFPGMLSLDNEGEHRIVELDLDAEFEELVSVAA